MDKDNYPQYNTQQKTQPHPNTHQPTQQKMSIIYSVITRPSPQHITNLCSYDIAHGNYPTICQQILKHIKITESKIYKYNNEYNFHILKDDILLFVCMAGIDVKNKTAFAFLQDVKRRFKEKYTEEEILGAKDYDMSAGFSDVFKELIDTYNTIRNQDNKDILIKQLNTLLPIMSENIQKVLQNEQKVSLVVKKTQKVHNIADQIRRNASLMKKDAFWKKNIWKILIVVIVVAAAVTLYFVI